MAHISFSMIFSCNKLRYTVFSQLRTYEPSSISNKSDYALIDYTSAFHRSGLIGKSLQDRKYLTSSLIHPDVALPPSIRMGNEAFIGWNIVNISATILHYGGVKMSIVTPCCAFNVTG